MTDTTSTRAPFTIADAIDRVIHSVALILAVLAVAAFAYRNSADVVAGWEAMAYVVRTAWDLVTLPFNYLVGLIG